MPGGCGGTSAPAVVTLTIASVNDAPVAADDAATVVEDSSGVIDVLANDTDVDGTLDPSTVLILTSPSNGSVSIDVTTGAVTYTPPPDFFGSDSFTYTVADNIGAVSNVATVTITTTDANEIPVFNMTLMRLLVVKTCLTTVLLMGLQMPIVFAQSSKQTKSSSEKPDKAEQTQSEAVFEAIHPSDIPVSASKAMSKLRGMRSDLINDPFIVEIEAELPSIMEGLRQLKEVPEIGMPEQFPLRTLDEVRRQWQRYQSH